MNPLRSYSQLHEVEPEVLRPESIDAVASALDRARREGRRLSFFAAGGSFDDQALNDDFVVALNRLPREVGLRDGLLDVDAPATWRSVLEAAVAHDHLPPIIPTSRRLTVGGSFASDAVS